MTPIKGLNVFRGNRQRGGKKLTKIKVSICQIAHCLSFKVTLQNPEPEAMKSTIVTFLVFISLSISSARADTWFTLADYKDLKARDIATAELVLKAMRETVFYAQESAGGSVICASPIPISGAHLIEMVEEEIEHPTNMMSKDYTEADQVAFVLMHALKKEGACK